MQVRIWIIRSVYMNFIKVLLWSCFLVGTVEGNISHRISHFPSVSSIQENSKLLISRGRALVRLT